MQIIAPCYAKIAAWSGLVSWFAAAGIISTIQIKGSITMIKTIVHLANCGECWEENRVILETINIYLE